MNANKLKNLTVTVCLSSCEITDDREAFAAYCEAQGYTVDRSHWNSTGAPAGTAGEETQQRLWEQFCNLPAAAYCELTGQGRC